ncbi:hypothetical protein BKA93DRAFT_736213 [Sparassis latifolia]
MSSTILQTKSARTAPTRLDGRKTDDLRPLTITYEGLARSDGSARFGFGPALTLASLSGPIEVRAALENPTQATLDVHVRPLAGIPGTDARALASTLKLLLTPSLFLNRCPRTLVQVVVQALCDRPGGAKGWGSVLVASAVNSASLALLSAGSVPMRGVVCAIAVGRVVLPGAAAGSGVLVLDPSDEELPRLTGGGCFAFLFSSALPSAIQAEEDAPPCELLWTDYKCQNGFGEDELFRARQIASGGAKAVWRAMKESVARMDTTMHSHSSKSGEEHRGDAMDEGGGESAEESEVDDDKMEIS